MHFILLIEGERLANNKKQNKKKNTYKDYAKTMEPKRSLFKNCIMAFLVGGSICTLGQALIWFFTTYFDYTEKNAGNPTAAVLIMISTLLTGFGIYDKIAQHAGAGTIVPITGFANAMTSAAIEHKSEGYVLGVGGNMFKLAGSVIVFGVFSSFVVAIIKIILLKIGGA